MGLGLSRFIDERRVDGVAVTRHPVLTLSTVLVGTVDHHWKFDGQLVLDVGCREILSDFTSSTGAEFVLDLAAPLDHRNSVREIVGLEQRETLVVVETAVEIDRFDVKVEVADQS